MPLYVVVPIAECGLLALSRLGDFFYGIGAASRLAVSFDKVLPNSVAGRRLPRLAYLQLSMVQFLL